MLLRCSGAFAHAHPYHEHEDLFGEEDLLIGFKAGSQITSYTQYHLGEANIAPQSRMRAAGGASFKFVYDLPRFELDVMWNIRGWVNTENSVSSAAFPFIINFPLPLTPGVELEVGPGVQPELTMFGADPHNVSMFSILVSAGASIDYKSFVVDLDLRYVYGLTTVSDFFSGAKTRDVQMLCGVLWHF